MERTGYQGWTNYETWCCNLWLDNDQGTQEMIEEWAKDAIEEAIDRQKSDIREAARESLAERIEAMIEEQAEEWMKDQASMFADLLNASLREIDYREIADSLVRDVPLFFAGWNMPGYMPDNTPAVFTDFETAKDYILEELERYSEEMAQDDRVESNAIVEMAIEDARKETKPFSVSCGSYAFWVTEV